MWDIMDENQIHSFIFDFDMKKTTCEDWIVNHLSRLLLQKRSILVIDSSKFPIMSCYIDTRDQELLLKKYQDDEFYQKVLQLWKTYDRLYKIPTIVLFNNGYMELRLKKLVLK